MAVAGEHPLESTQACATHQVEQQGFRIVVGMMRDGKCPYSRRPPPAVAQLAASHLDRFAGLGHTGRHIEMPDGERYPHLSAQVAAELLVAVALGSAQMEIAVICLDLDTEAHKYPQQCHRVGTSAQPHRHRVAMWREQRMEAAERIDRGGETCHISSAKRVADDADTMRTLTVSPTR